MFECTACGGSINADLNAARNILTTTLIRFGLDEAKARQFIGTDTARGRRAGKPVEGKRVGLLAKQLPCETPFASVVNTTTGSVVDA